MHLKKNVPSLESLVNQCYKDYYSELAGSELPIREPLSIDIEPTIEENNLNYKRFRDFIKVSHCQENLKFLIEIYYYEKIWNKIFKRKSSVLKCKDESMERSRKQSVVTVFTNSSSFKRHSSIVEFPEDKTTNEKIDELLPPTLYVSDSDNEIDEISPGTVTHTLENKDANNFTSELSIPTVIKSPSDFDTLSFVDEEVSFNPSTNLISNQLKTQKFFKNSKKSNLTSNNEVWDSLFKASYFESKDHKCCCKKDTQNHDLTDVESDEYNESVNQPEIRKKLKEELSERFNYIVKNYVLTNSPFEINLPDEVYSNLVTEYENPQILYHSPLTLLPAKNAVLQLLRENIYYNFLAEQEKIISKEHTKVSAQEVKNTSPPLPSIEQPQPRSPPQIIEHLDDMTAHSTISEESQKTRSSTPIATISNILNKYNLKINNGSFPTVSSVDKSPTTTTTYQEKKHHHKHSTKYIKAPCGIEPHINSYDPKPPSRTIHSGWASKFSKLRLKKKASQ